MEALNIPYTEIGWGFIVGLAVGFFLKKSLKIALFVIGATILVIFGAEQLGIVTLNEEVLQDTVNGGIEAAKGVAGMVKERLLAFSAGGASAALGFVAGLKMG